ncbi:MAG: flagellar biosynthesis protein FlgD [Pirellulales bacterium]|nr:flagellar biosynthesis protein FlgD [Pirellulales bacterium]
MISSTSSVQGQSGQQSTVGDAFDSVRMQDFINLLVSELQNQDPLNPVNNSEILQQVSQIKAIQANDRLSDTLTSLQYQQALVTASSLIQQNVVGMTDYGMRITGKVDSVSIENQEVFFHIGGDVVAMKNLISILPQE